MTNAFFPFGLAPGTNPAQSQAYDLVINEENPGIILEPTEPNGVVTVFREVAGCSWWVVNADYNTDNANWEQLSPCNAALPAYAIEQCASGTVTRYVAAATDTPGTAITWIPVWTLDQYGNQTNEPQTGTTSSEVASVIDVTWQAGSPTTMNARELNVTDTSSNAASLIDNLNVNDTPVWQVRKDGTLVTGIIPYARITGAPTPPSFNNPTFTGTATFDGPVDATDGLTVTGGETVDTLHVTGNEQVDGNLNVNGTTTTHNLDVTGTATLPASAVPVTDITGSGGVVVTDSGTTWNVDGSALVETVESSDGTVTVNRSGQIVNLTAGTHTPVTQGAWFINTAFFAEGSTSGSINLGPLPGNSSNTYRIVCWGSLQFTDASKTFTLTGVTATGVTWDSNPQNYENSQSGSFPFMFFGTAVGGTSPTIDWSCNDTVNFTPLFMTIAAGIQL